MRYFIFNVLSLLSFISYSQDYRISGAVQDAQTGENLQYVNIYFNNLNIGTVTNSKGEYVLNVKKENLPDTLSFSYIGYDVAKFLIDESIKKNVLNVELKQKINEISTIKVVDKKPNPVKTLKTTYDFLKNQQNKIYQADYYTRISLKYNDRFIYGAKGFFNGYVGDQPDKKDYINYMVDEVDLWHKSKLISLDVKANDSLLYSHKIPGIYFYAMNSKIPLKKIRRLSKKADIEIDTVIFYAKSKLYVLNVNYNFNDTIPSSYDMIINQDLTKSVLNQIKDNCTKEIRSYKFYIEVKDDNYFLKKMEKIIIRPSKDFYYHFIKMECYYKMLDGNIIPNYQNCFEAYVSDTANYYIYNDYVITKFDSDYTIDKTYTCIDFLIPRYDKYSYDVRSEKKKEEGKSEIKEIIHNSNNPNFNYIKQDTLELIINKDLK